MTSNLPFVGVTVGFCPAFLVVVLSTTGYSQCSIMLNGGLMTGERDNQKASYKVRRAEHVQGPVRTKEPVPASAYLQALPLARESRSSMPNIDLTMTIVQKSRTQILVFGDHNSHMYMIFQLRYVASRQEITQGSRKVGMKALEEAVALAEKVNKVSDFFCLRCIRSQAVSAVPCCFCCRSGACDQKEKTRRRHQPWPAGKTIYDT